MGKKKIVLPGENYEYAAFISYRHVEPDKSVAEALHRAIETYRLPKEVAKVYQGNFVGRVFRDEEELPLATNLEDSIVKALKNSRWLIVICSPNLKESTWCQKEIETFIQYHGKQRVLLVLADGEPNEVFPEILTYREVLAKREDGKTEVLQEKIEPLAADLRAKNDRQRKKQLKIEIMRLLAPMLNLNFDDLRQRHKERTWRRRMLIAALVAVGSLAFGIYSALTYQKIQKQNEQIVAQSQEIGMQKTEIEQQLDTIISQQEQIYYDQALSLASMSQYALEKDQREEAIAFAYASLTEQGDVKLPETAEGRRALFDALPLYYGYNRLVPLYELTTEGNIQFLYANGQKDAADQQGDVIVYDSSGTLTAWDLYENEVLNSLHAILPNERQGIYLDNGLFAYSYSEGIAIWDPQTNAVQEATMPMPYSLTAKGETLYGYYVNADGSCTLFSLKSRDTASLQMLQIREMLVEDIEYLEGGRLAYITEDLDDEAQLAYKLQILNWSTGEVELCQDLEDYGRIVEMASVRGQYLAAVEYTEVGKTCVYALQRQQEEPLWSLELEEGKLLHLRCYAGADGRPQAVLLFDNRVEIRDIETGAQLDILYLPMPCYSCKFGADYLFCYLAEGGVLRLNVTTGGTIYSQEFMEYQAGAAAQMQYFQDACLVNPKNSGRLICYDFLLSDGLDAGGDWQSPQSPPMELAQGMDAVRLAEDLNLERSKVVISMAHVADWVIISYGDGTRETYSVEGGVAELIDAAYTSCDYGVIYSWGEDPEGNYYLGDGSNGYILSPKGEFLGVIPNMLWYRSETNTIGLEFGDRFYEAPAYSLEDLLRLAEQYCDLG